jgi:hypothetical protein
MKLCKTGMTVFPSLRIISREKQHYFNVILHWQVYFFFFLQFQSYKTAFTSNEAPYAFLSTSEE